MWCVVVSLSACASPEEKQRRLDSAMVEQAKLDAQDEAEFVEDSVKLASSITVDTIYDIRTVPTVGRDADGREFTYDVYTVTARNNQRCLVEPARFTTLVRGDTLSCQWESAP
jgi:hypothetical protein